MNGNTHSEDMLQGIAWNIEDYIYIPLNWVCHLAEANISKVER